MRDQHDPRYLIAGYVSTLVGGHPEDSLPHADAILAGLRSVVDRGDANATFAAYTEGFAACLRILRDALGLDEEARDA